MKIHCINILLFSAPLNILVNTHKKTCITQKIPTSRLLCECQLYSPVNYDNDHEMNELMKNFNKQTQQRLHEYDERMKTTRQECKEQCDKEIQKIILKDKLEKELTEKFATLQTDVQSDAIPTCVCEKSIADKVEKGCLKCAQNLGGIGAPSSGVLGEIAALAVNGWKTTAIEAAIAAAEKFGAAEGAIAGIHAGKKVVIEVLKYFNIDKLGIKPLDSVFTKGYYIDVANLTELIITKKDAACSALIADSGNDILCTDISNKLGTVGKNALTDREGIKRMFNVIVYKSKQAADTEATQVAAAKTAEFGAAQEKAIETASYNLYSAIGYSVLAILIIVLIMVIIYLVLRYRRKKKMKKKLQYIKLLNQ
ncbi:rifin [Plasmodium sp. gorilla clade G1]|nr:rifin [Plasmodium sp. gorilla clade G1]